MAQNTGTLITSAIRPNDSTDLIASAFASEIKGGLHLATASSDRNSIIIQRRDWGMMCYVINDNQTYQLEYNYSSTNIMDNNNWKPFSGSGGGGGSTASEWLSSAISFLNTQPASPSGGDRYILGNSPTGVVWSSLSSGAVVEYDSVITTWNVTNPTNGTSIRVDNEDNAIYRYEGNFPSGTWEKERESQIRYITTTSPDGFSYSASATPSFANYDPELLFITKFNTTNIGATASLNINGLGNRLIKKAFGQSLTDLVASDISTNYPYVLTYDGSNFILVKPQQDNVSFNVQYNVPSSDTIIVPTNTQYWVYGDLSVDGDISGTGRVIVTNGNLNIGTFGVVSVGELILNYFAEIDGLGQPNYVPRWKTSFMLTATSSIYDDGQTLNFTGNTFSVNSSNIYIPSGASNGYVLTSNVNGIATWQPPSGGLKYSATQSFSAGVTYSISHNLNTKDILVNFWDDVSGELVIVDVVRTSDNAIDVNSAVSLASGRIVVIA